jgi:hypothetical protein
LRLDLAELLGAGDLARGERVVGRRQQPERPQPVAVEVRDRLVAVARDDRGGAVARAQEHAHRFVERREPVARRGQARRFGQQRQDRLRQAQPSGQQRDHHVVEVRGVRAARADDRPHACADLLEPRVALGQQAHEIGPDRLHPGDVALDGRDLAVVAERPERLRAAPGGRGVGAVAAVEQHETRGVVRVAQVRVELADLRQLGEPLVDDRAVRQARDREVVADLLAQHLVEREPQQVAAGEPAVLGKPRRPAKERLAHDRRRAARRGARRQRVEVERHVLPAEHVGLGERGELLDALDAAAPRHRVERQEEHAERYVALGDQADVVREAVEQQRPRDVEQQARAVARRAAVVELPAQLERDVDETALGDALARGQEAHAARVPLVVDTARESLVGVQGLRETARIRTIGPRGQRRSTGYCVMPAIRDLDRTRAGSGGARRGRRYEPPGPETGAPATIGRLFWRSQ